MEMGIFSSKQKVAIGEKVNNLITDTEFLVNGGFKGSITTDNFLIVETTSILRIFLPHIETVTVITIYNSSVDKDFFQVNLIGKGVIMGKFSFKTSEAAYKFQDWLLNKIN
jgi:hypothetical protein